jgi:hypothetical protein
VEGLSSIVRYFVPLSLAIQTSRGSPVEEVGLSQLFISSRHLIADLYFLVLHTAGSRSRAEGTTAIFGYGSLIFKPPPFNLDSTPGYIKGFVRRFAQESHDHRGTDEYPGRGELILQTMRSEFETLAENKFRKLFSGDARY